MITGPECSSVALVFAQFVPRIVPRRVGRAARGLHLDDRLGALASVGLGARISRLKIVFRLASRVGGESVVDDLDTRWPRPSRGLRSTCRRDTFLEKLAGLVGKGDSHIDGNSPALRRRLGRQERQENVSGVGALRRAAQRHNPQGARGTGLVDWSA